MSDISEAIAETIRTLVVENERLTAINAELLAACEAAMRIQDLWMPPIDCDSDEADVLSMMSMKFTAAIAKSQEETK